MDRSRLSPGPKLISGLQDWVHCWLLTHLPHQGLQMTFTSEAIKLQILWFCGPEPKQRAQQYISSLTAQSSEPRSYRQPGHVSEHRRLWRRSLASRRICVLPQLSPVSYTPGVICCWVRERRLRRMAKRKAKELLEFRNAFSH